MSSDPLTTLRVYERIKAEIIGGRFPPRAVLVERVLASEYRVSVSPVRNGAYRLLGEGLLELHPGGGFQIPDIEEPALRDLYFWHGQLVRNAINAKRRQGFDVAFARSEVPDDLTTPVGVAAAAAHLFSFIARQSPNTEHRKAILTAGKRLYPVRIKEPLVINGVVDEILAVRTLTATGPTSDLITAIWAYHRRRIRRVGDLVVAAGGTPIGSENG